MTVTLQKLTPPEPTPEKEIVGEKRPTAKSLKRHGERYGWEGVADIAAQYGISLTIPRAKKETKTKGPPLQKRIAGHLERGVSWTGIAELENLSPRRARELQQKFEEKA